MCIRDSQGAIGCLGARFFNKDGKILDNAWNRRCVGIELEDIRKIKEVIVVALSLIHIWRDKCLSFRAMNEDGAGGWI